MPVPFPVLRIATRGSALALRQTAIVRERLAAAHADLAAAGAIEIVTIRTTGDRVQDRPLAEIGGKGLFAKEIEEALRAGRADCAVHSLKDLETRLPEGFELAATLPRADPRDALLARGASGFWALPQGARVGTSSLRRRAQLLWRRPDLRIVPLRGNVDTRLEKLASGDLDAIVVALCGLERLGRAGLASEILEPELVLPAVGQGAIAVECRAGDERVKALLRSLDDPDTALCTGAERAMLATLDGSCRTPIAGLARLAEGQFAIEGLLAASDGSAVVCARRAGPMAEATALGAALGDALRRRAGPAFGLA
ncbi:MAG TPA: hydroxymethylbilane synthase [Stellaceae bacterium]|nr:hydroxymethylbilane synthase [Stellaceae bacterium]